MSQIPEVDFDGRIDIDPRIVILYAASHGYAANTSDPEDAVKRIRTMLLRTHSRLHRLMMHVDRDRWQPITEDLLLERVRRSFTKRYSQRPSPRFSATDYMMCTMPGNDGHLYAAVPRGGTFVWRRRD
jgi:hypothetical protein